MAPHSQGRQAAAAKGMQAALLASASSSPNRTSCESPSRLASAAASSTTRSSAQQVQTTPVCGTQVAGSTPPALSSAVRNAARAALMRAAGITFVDAVEVKGVDERLASVECEQLRVKTVQLRVETEQVRLERIETRAQLMKENKRNRAVHAALQGFKNAAKKEARRGDHDGIEFFEKPKPGASSSSSVPASAKSAPTATTVNTWTFGASAVASLRAADAIRAARARPSRPAAPTQAATPCAAGTPTASPLRPSSHTAAPTRASPPSMASPTPVTTPVMAVAVPPAVQSSRRNMCVPHGQSRGLRGRRSFGQIMDMASFVDKVSQCTLRACVLA